MLCPKCKKTIPMFSKFCPKCGTEAKLTIANKRDWRATKIINWGLILSVLIMITTIVIAVAIKDKSDQEPYRTAFVIVFTICLVVFGLSLLAALIKPLIIKIGSIDEHPAKGSTALFVLVCFIVLLCWGGYKFVIEISKPKPFPDSAGLLAGAILYSEKEPAPVTITYTNEKGQSVSALAYPGEINIFVKTQTTTSTAVADMIKPYNGTILSQIPKLGFYIIGVEDGKEAETIKDLLKNQKKLVLSAAPNVVVQGSAVVDLSGTGKTDPGTVFPALISSPDPKAKIIVAQLDNFVPLASSDKNKVNVKNYENFGSPDSHGAQVLNAMKPIIGNTPVMQVHVGGWPCSMPSDLCSSAGHTVNALAAVVAGAEMNGQKVDVNLSYSLSPRTTDPDKFTTARLAKTNSWATDQWKSYEDQLYNVLNNSEWAKKGNVILNQSAGNGAQLVDADGQVLKSVGMNVTNALNDLKQKYPKIQGAVNLVAALDNKTGQLAWYSNFGTGVTEVKLSPNSPDGTSFAAPLITGASLNAWKQVEFGPNVVNTAVRNFAKQTADFYNFDAKTKKQFYSYVEYFEEVQKGKAAEEKLRQEDMKTLIELNAKHSAENPPDDPCAPDLNTGEVDECLCLGICGGVSPSIKPDIGVPLTIPEPPPVDINSVDVGQQTISDCERWGGLVDSKTGETYEMVNGKRVPCPK